LFSVKLSTFSFKFRQIDNLNQIGLTQNSRNIAKMGA
jgi:hypothetical protein